MKNRQHVLQRQMTGPKTAQPTAHLETVNSHNSMKTQSSAGSGANSNRIREAAKKQTTSVYLTLIAIIQSFVLGFLLSTVQTISKESPVDLWPINAHSLVTWFEILGVFQALVLCWHVHTNNAIILSRVVGLSDSYIPFVFAIPQFLLVVSLHPRSLPLWFLGMSFYSLVAFWAYADM